MFNPSRLQLARRRRRWTARELAQRSSVSAVTLSRLENGTQRPDTETLEKLGQALGFDAAFFALPDVDLLDTQTASFRSLTSMTARERDAATAAGSIAFDFVDWVKGVGRFRLPPVDILDLGYESDPAAAARILRQHWGIGERPIGNIIKLLESKGIRVFSLSENTRTVDAYSCWRGDEPYVFLNTFKNPERSRFDAAHELGHLCYHKHGGPQGREAEHQANLFASSFLMPSQDVRAIVPYASSLRELISAKQRWGVSLSALVYRLHKLGILSDWQQRSFYIQINRDYGVTEPNGLEAERSSVWQMVLTELWKEGVTRSQISRTLLLPQSELDGILFGLMGETVAPARLPRPALKIVE